MRVLIVSTVGLRYNGISSVVLANLQAMDRSGMEIYVAGTVGVVPELRAQVEAMGCKIVDMPCRRAETTKYFFALWRFIRKAKIQVIHAHGNSGTLAIEMLAAWLGGCKRRIAHSHNTTCEQIRADKLTRPVFDRLYTDALACGEAAGRWLFRDRPFTVLNNGRDVNAFRYSGETREKVRTAYHLENKIAIGHVGNFIDQKNHRFLIDIFHAIHRKEPNAVFFLIGDGELRPEIEERVRASHMEDWVTFTGITDKVPELLQAMDGMVLPSLYEGLPLVVIEWQLAALPCVISDVITRECAVTDSVEFCPLESGADIWAEKILTKISEHDRQKSAPLALEAVKAAGFDIADNGAFLRKLYL